MLTGTHTSPLGVFIHQKEVEAVDDFTYLSSPINSNGDNLTNNTTTAQEKHQLLSANWARSGAATDYHSVSSCVFTTLMHSHTSVWLRNLALKTSQERQLNSFDT